MRSNYEIFSESDKRMCSVFKTPNLEEMLKVFNCKHNLEFLKDMALKRLEKAVIDQLECLTLVDTSDFSDMKKFSKNIFNWSKADFLERRSLENCVWIDVIMKHTRNDCLESFKIQIDLIEFKTLLKLIFEGLQSSKKNLNLESLIYKSLSEAERYFNIFEQLIYEKKMLMELLQDNQFRFNARLFTKHHSKQKLVLRGIEDTLLNAQIWDPIQMRFQINWYNCKTEQLELKSSIKENIVRKEINEYKLKSLTEKMSGDNIRDTYYNLAELYKRDIDVLQNQFDSEIDKVDNKINYIRLQNSKLIEQQKILSDQIKKFHEEIKKRMEKEHKERLWQKLEHSRLDEDAASDKQKNSKTKHN